jgi:hypothetical protein
VFGLKLAVQMLPQLIPAGEDDTVPVPVPDLAIVSETWPGGGGGISVKVAVQLEFAVRTIWVLAEVPEQLPVHLVNVEPTLGVADSVTVVF